jgi:glycosyltransferase involved in cell wall biosynthesis
MIRLGLYHEPVHADGESFDTYGAYARYVLEFARHFDRVTVFAPATTEPTYFSGCSLAADNVTVVPLPFFLTHAQALRHGLSIARIFRRHSAELDVINARGTAPLAYLLWLMTRRRGVPFIYHFASDPFEVIAQSPRYRGPYRLFARLAYGAEFHIQKHIMRRGYSFASGEALCQRLRQVTPNVEAVITSTLRQEDYHRRKDSCTRGTVRVLYVGYLRDGKGLDDLLQAVRILRDAGRNVELDIVGEGDMQKPLTDQAGRLGLGKHVHFHGYVVMGPPLNARYNRSDVLALPSVSEGSPKVVLEALGHSLPVVATTVGNVPEMLAGGQRGAVVPAKDPPALAAGIARMMDDGEFRRRCIREGYAFARQHSLEAFVARMAAKARELAGEARGGRKA